VVPQIPGIPDNAGDSTKSDRLKVRYFLVMEEKKITGGGSSIWTESVNI
jgi:hypothetical protein